jgi:anti-anti-sigma regulatory factor
MPSPPDPVLDEGPILLPANGTTVAAEELQVRLVLAADRLPEIRIDASQVENVGQAVLQLLVAARTEADERGLDFEILSPSAAFLARVQACRLVEPLGLSPKELAQ